MTSPQLSYASGISTTPLSGETMSHSLARSAAVHGERTALVDCPSGRRWTYAELVTAADEVAAGLLERGISTGDRVGLWAQNVPEWTIVQYACATLGAILVNINPAYRTHELAYVLGQSGCRLLISQVSAPPHSDFAAIAREAVSQLGAEAQAAEAHSPAEAAEPAEASAGPGVVPDLLFLDTVPGLLGADSAAGVLPEESFAAAWERGRALLADDSAKVRVRLQQIAGGLSCDDPINLQYTSGTTGFPKGVTLTHHNLVNNGRFIGEQLGYTPDDVVVLPVPYFHCFGMVIGTLAIVPFGACAVIPSPGFDAAAALRAVQEEGGTSIYGVPTMFIAELSLPDFQTYDLSTLRTGVMAGAPCPVEVMKQVMHDMHMPEVAICYGSPRPRPSPP